MQMDGQEVFKFAVRKVPEITKKIMEDNGVSQEDIRYFVLHQANYRILEAVSRRLNIPMEKIPVNLDQYGNTSAASILYCWMKCTGTAGWNAATGLCCRDSEPDSPGGPCFSNGNAETSAIRLTKSRRPGIMDSGFVYKSKSKIKK